VAQLLQDLPQLSSKDMKAHIAELGGSSQDCLEKKDLEQRLRRLLLDKLSDEVTLCVCTYYYVRYDYETL
jgi:hypothetical protein